jgi:hypothetical protein
VLSLVKEGSLLIRLNEENIPYFKPGKGLRQGNPLSPLLFNLVIDVFSGMLVKAVANGHITGLMGSLYPEGVVSLQYADDTLLFLEHNYKAASHLKWLLMCFEKLSGMKINYHKNDLISNNLDEEESQTHSRVFCCKLGEFPFKYLGVPLHYEKLRKEDIQTLIDKIIKRIAGWKGRLLSYGARLALLRACLASIPLYLMPVIKFSKLAIEAINSHMANFFWDDNEDKHRYHLSNWYSLTQRNEHGGIPDFGDLNFCLLASWVQRYYQAEGRMWKNIVDHKYNLNSPNLFCCDDRGSSPFWKWILWTTKAIKMGYEWQVGNGRRVRF